MGTCCRSTYTRRISISERDPHSATPRIVPFQDSSEVEPQACGEIQRPHQGECGIRGGTHKSHEVARQGSQGDEEDGESEDCWIAAVRRICQHPGRRSRTTSDAQTFREIFLSRRTHTTYIPPFGSGQLLLLDTSAVSCLPGCKYSFSNCSGVS
jgi:hypothetical protein